MRPRIGFALCLVALFLGWENKLYGFGFTIHVSATRIAEARLTEKARARVKALLALSAKERQKSLETTSAWSRTGHKKLGKTSDFESASLWADFHRANNRDTAMFHYVNVPLALQRYDARFDPEKKHLVSKLNEFVETLKSPTASEEEKAIALLWVIHLLEDVHMPLHVATNDDRGGNLTKVKFNARNTDLHALWDKDLMESAAPSVDACVKLLTPYDTEENRKRWMSGTIEDWASESAALAPGCYRVPGKDKLIASGDTLGRDYADKNLPVLCERSTQAGIRLAYLLNTVFK